MSRRLSPRRGHIAANVCLRQRFANAFPRLITFKTGGLITGSLGMIHRGGCCGPSATSSTGCSALRGSGLCGCADRRLRDVRKRNLSPGSLSARRPFAGGTGPASRPQLRDARSRGVPVVSPLRPLSTTMVCRVGRGGPGVSRDARRSTCSLRRRALRDSVVESHDARGHISVARQPQPR